MIQRERALISAKRYLGSLQRGCRLAGHSKRSRHFRQQGCGRKKNSNRGGIHSKRDQAGNYALIPPTTTATITAAPWIVTSLTANNKVYDGTKIATLDVSGAVLEALYPGDSVTVSSGKGTFSTLVGNNDNVGSISVVLGGLQALDYIGLASGLFVANVTPAPLTVTGITAGNKVYDATATATLDTGAAALVGKRSGDFVSLVTSGATGAFVSTSVGTSLVVSIGGLSLSGSNAADYTLMQPTTSANITTAPLTILAVPNTKFYDSITAAAALPAIAGLVGTDTVTGLSEAYANVNAGSSKTLSISAYTINDGNGGNNYAITTVVNTTGTINRAALTITATTNTKTYDATIAAGATPAVSGLVGSDMVTGLTEVYNDRNAGTGKVLSISTYTVNDGNGGSDYAVTTVATGAGVINTATLTITATSNTKTYDSTLTAASVPTVSGLLGNDTATGQTELYDTANAGTGKTLTVQLGAHTTAIASLTGLGDPYGLAFDKSGNLFVADFRSNVVKKYAPGGTTAIATLTGVSGPQALAFDAAGNLYVGNSDGDFKGTTVSKFAFGATTPSATLTGLNWPQALALDTTGNLYVVNSNGTTVSKFAPGATTPTATLTGLNKPQDLVFDAAGNLYVTNGISAGTVSKFAPGGMYA